MLPITSGVEFSEKANYIYLCPESNCIKLFLIKVQECYNRLYESTDRYLKKGRHAKSIVCLACYRSDLIPGSF